MMYDELVKRLRESKNEQCYIGCFGNCGDCKIDAELEQAADAIEELQGKHFMMKKTAEWLAEKVPKWIPVTERLPEQRINQNTLDFEYVLCATTFGDVRPFKYGRRIGQGDAHFWNGAGYVDAYVTHWMPLPEPPKEDPE